jgi:hypothetical protein
MKKLTELTREHNKMDEIRGSGEGKMREKANLHLPIHEIFPTIAATQRRRFGGHGLDA